jgi:hypothetical protein
VSGGGHSPLFPDRLPVNPAECGPQPTKDPLSFSLRLAFRDGLLPRDPLLGGGVGLVK